MIAHIALIAALIATPAPIVHVEESKPRNELPPAARYVLIVRRSAYCAPMINLTTSTADGDMLIPGTGALSWNTPLTTSCISIDAELFDSIVAFQKRMDCGYGGACYNDSEVIGLFDLTTATRVPLTFRTIETTTPRHVEEDHSVRREWVVEEGGR